jgi:hypothetical protein
MSFPSCEADTRFLQIIIRYQSTKPFAAARSASFDQIRARRGKTILKNHLQQQSFPDTYLMRAININASSFPDLSSQLCRLNILRLQRQNSAVSESLIAEI